MKDFYNKSLIFNDQHVKGQYGDQILYVSTLTKLMVSWGPDRFVNFEFYFKAVFDKHVNIIERMNKAVYAKNKITEYIEKVSNDRYLQLVNLKFNVEKIFPLEPIILDYKHGDTGWFVDVINNISTIFRPALIY
jgi:hypothetical protein